MPEQELDLFQLPASCVAEPGTTAAQVVRRKRKNAGRGRILPDDVPHHLLGSYQYPRHRQLY